MFALILATSLTDEIRNLLSVCVCLSDPTLPDRWRPPGRTTKRRKKI